MNQSPFEPLESRVLMSATPVARIPRLPTHDTPPLVRPPVIASIPRIPSAGPSTSKTVTAPTVVNTDVLTRSEVMLTWAGDTGVTVGYTIQRSSNGISGWNNVGTTAANGRSFVNSGLVPRTSYFYRIVAEGAGGATAISRVVEVNTRFG